MEIRIYTDNTGHAPFVQWVDGLSDRIARAKIRARLTRVEAGNMGDCKPLRDGVQELCINHGPGYRVYLSKQGPVLVLLLCGSDKGSQEAEIHRAIGYLNDWKERGQTMNTPRDASHTTWLTESLKDPQEAAAYIEAAIELEDPAALLVALRHVAKAHGMAEVARRADVGEKSLFRALSENGNPTIATLHKVLHAVGLRLSVTPEHA